MGTILLEDLGADLVLMARLVQSQLVSAMTAFFQKDVVLAQRVTGKDDQVDNLLGFIEEKCFERIAGEPAGSPRSLRLRGVFRVAVNLEKLGDSRSTSPSRRCTSPACRRARFPSTSPARPASPWP